ncbi:DMT family transporter [Paenibacillus sp. 481]|uniref:DMT family transporter n=1 Tax=Paenibacillus sp. 481 TaxID=2835869 RepID=UPI001E5AF270|nr:DMT family transporter [Paenibacillus sp. 481]
MRVGIYLLLVFTSMLWGGNFVASKLLVEHADALTLTLCRWGIAVLFWLPIVWLKERRILPPKQAWLPLSLMGLTGVVLFNVSMFMALEQTTATNTGLISALNPVAIALLSFIIYRERLNRWQVVAMIVSLGGALLFLLRGEMSRLWSLQFNVGDLWMLCAVAFWAIYSVTGKWALRYVSPYMSTFWGGVLGVVCLLPFKTDELLTLSGDMTFWSSILYISFGSTMLAMLFWNVGVQQVGGTQAGIFLNLNPIFTGTFAYFLLGEQMVGAQWLGAAIVMIGVFGFTLAGILRMNKERALS